MYTGAHVNTLVIMLYNGGCEASVWQAKLSSQCRNVRFYTHLDVITRLELCQECL